MSEDHALLLARRSAERALAAVQVFARRFRNWGAREFLTAGLLFPTAFVTGAWWAEGVRLQGHALPGTQILGEPVGGYSTAALTDWLGAARLRLAKQPLRVAVGTQTFTISAAVLGVRLDVDQTRALVLASGRSGGLARRIRERAARAWGEVAEVSPSTEIDKAGIAAAALSWQTSALENLVEGTIELQGRRFVGRWPRAGVSIDSDELRERAVAKILAGEVDLDAPTREVAPKLTRRAVELALEQAAQLTQRELRLRHPDDAERALILTPSELRAALKWKLEDGPPARLSFSFATEPLAKPLARQRPLLEVPAKDAVFEIDGREQIKILPAETGSKIDQQRLLELLLELASSDRDESTLPIIHGVAPQLTTEDAAKQNIRGLVSTFTTSHPCCQPRVDNIHRIADLLDGVLVRSGQTFSVNDFVGPRTIENGFLPAPTIVVGEIEDTVGGGVSQFATTLFNAVLRGGYEIIERQPHSYYFQRYPAGHEATLSFPKPDLIFRNDTKNGLLIKAHYGSTFVRVKIYGDNEGRRVENSHSKPYESTPPPVVYAANDELLPGEEKVKERGQHGFKIAVWRVVTSADGQAKKEQRVVMYKPRDRVIEVHSCQISEGEEGHTGEECPEQECDPEREDCEITCAPDDKACLISRSGEWTPPSRLKAAPTVE